jgi:hypothetical protein
MTLDSSANRPVPFEKALCLRAVHLIRQRHAPRLLPKEAIVIEGELSHGYALARLIASLPDGASRVCLEVSIELEPNQIDHPGQGRDLALDFLDIFFDKFLSEERLLLLSPTWIAHDFEGKSILMRGAHTRPALDDEADRLLAAAGFDPNGDPLS